MHFTLPEPPDGAARPAPHDRHTSTGSAAELECSTPAGARGCTAAGATRFLFHPTPDAIRWLTIAEPSTWGGSVGAPTLHLFDSAHARYTVGRRSFEAGPGDAVLVPPDVLLTCEWRVGRYCAVQLPAASIAAALRARRPRSRGEAYLRATRLPLDADTGAALTQALQAFVVALAGDRQLLPDARHRLAGWLAGTALAAGAVVPVQPLRATRAQRLEKWIEAHLGEPITLQRLCDLAGVGSRCLQKSFEVRHGTSPLDYVMQRRLAAARERLLNASRGAQVIQIALDVGATHLGRFSQRYRAAFGEPPSMTLRRQKVG